MKEKRVGSRIYLQSDLLSAGGRVVHGFTTRLGGVSAGKIEGLNLGFRVGDDPCAVRTNYELVAQDLHLQLDRMVLARQTHTDHIRMVTAADAGKGIVRESDIEDTDGLITDIPGIALVIFSADCVPLLFADPVRRVVAASHAGWRGTVKEIGRKTVALMQREYSCKPEQITAAIGPSIGPCCFEVDAGTAANFDRRYVTEKADGKCLVDLWRVNRDQLIVEGILKENIDIAAACTICETETYYSYRRQKEHTGRQGAVIMLKETEQ